MLTTQKSATLTDAEIDAIVGVIRAREIVKRGKPVVRDTVITFGKRTVDDLFVGDLYNSQDAEVQRFIRRWGVRSRKINTTTKKKLRKLLADAVKRGDSVSKIRREIQRKFESMSKSRALTIARTEVARASNFGTLSGLKQADVPGKEWLSVRDAAVRDTHRVLDGQQRKTNEPFTSPSGATAQYPGGFGKAEEDVQCRCGIIAVVTKRRGYRHTTWKSLESERAPFDRRMTRAFRLAFAAQRDAVLAALPTAA